MIREGAIVENNCFFGCITLANSNVRPQFEVAGVLIVSASSEERKKCILIPDFLPRLRDLLTVMIITFSFLPNSQSVTWDFVCVPWTTLSLKRIKREIKVGKLQLTVNVWIDQSIRVTQDDPSHGQHSQSMDDGQSVLFARGSSSRRFAVILGRFDGQNGRGILFEGKAE